MSRMWMSRRVLVAAWFAALGSAVAACGPAPTPQEGVPASVEQAKSSGVIAKYADELVDLSTFPEPPVSQLGGIPPADLSATPKSGGLLRVGWTSSQRYDPHFPVASGPAGWLNHVFANGLLKWDVKCNCPQPDLAESWTVAPDGLSYDFKIRKGIRFHNRPPVNGREVTIQDIKWSLDRVSGLEPHPGKQGIFWARFANAKEFQIIDDTTLRLVMKQPDVQIMAEVMYDHMVVLPKEAGIDDTYEQAKTLIGSGPFMMDFAQAGGQFRGIRNPDYWEKDAAGRQLPYIDRFETLGVLDTSAVQAAFKTKQSDWISMNYDAARGLLGDPNVRYYINRGLQIGAVGIYMNTTRPPFGDVRVRRAVNLGLDREEFIDAVYGGPDSDFVMSMLGGWQPWHWGEDKMWSMSGYAKGEGKKKEIAEARRLLAEAGYPNGIKNLDYWDPGSGGVFFDVLHKQMKEIGIELTLNSGGGSQMRYATFMKDKDIAYASSGGGHTPDYAVTTAYLCTSVQNMSNYCNPEIDKLFKEERQERDTAKRIQLIDKMQQILFDDMPMAPLIRQVKVQMSRNDVRGWRNDWYTGFSQGQQMAHVWLDR